MPTGEKARDNEGRERLTPWNKLGWQWWRNAALRVAVIIVVTIGYTALLDQFLSDQPQWIIGIALIPLVGLLAVYWPTRESAADAMSLKQVPLVMSVLIAATAGLFVVGLGAVFGIERLATRDDPPSEFQSFNQNLAETFADKPEGTSRAVAVMKNGIAGEDWLMTVHGYANNRATCEMLIEPYNEDSELSVFAGEYYCKEL